jgi:hypothetical protein
MSRTQWVRSQLKQKPPEVEKAAITAACERFLAEVLRPRFMPEIRPSTAFNDPVAIQGKWHGNKYRFLQRFRCDDPDALEPEFDAPFARLESFGRACFDVSWYRQTGEWCLHRSVSPTEALRLIKTDGHLHPV